MVDTDTRREERGRLIERLRNKLKTLGYLLNFASDKGISVPQFMSEYRKLRSTLETVNIDEPIIKRRLSGPLVTKYGILKQKRSSANSKYYDYVIWWMCCMTLIVIICGVLNMTIISGVYNVLTRVKTCVGKECSK
jgi:hypothetical protein